MEEINYKNTNYPIYLCVDNILLTEYLENELFFMNKERTSMKKAIRAIVFFYLRIYNE